MLEHFFDILFSVVGGAIIVSLAVFFVAIIVLLLIYGFTPREKGD